MNRQNFALLAFALVAATAGIAAGIWSFRAEAPADAGFIYPEPRPVPAFELVRHDGTRFDSRTLAGRWSFVYFGFTYCPDVCPTALVDLSRVQQSLEREGLDRDTRYYFVSVDPKRDTPARLAEYVVHFNSRFWGVTGDLPELERFARAVGVGFSYPQGTDGDHYPVDHTSLVVLFGPDAKVHAVFPSPHRPDVMIEGFRRATARAAASPLSR
ncbi:MAG TPA: SCO family protein [Burkholderiales bacterium]